MTVDDVRSLLLLATDTPIIIAYQNGPRPALPYIAVRVTNTNVPPIATGEIDADGVQELSVPCVSRCELQYFGEGGADALASLALRVQGQAMIDAAEAAGVALEPSGDVQDIPILRDGGRYEPRAVLELDYSFVLSHSEAVGFIETVQGSGTTSESNTEGPTLEFVASIATSG